MNIKTVNSHLSGRLGAATNEDRVFFYPLESKPDIAGIADGATPKTAWRNTAGRTSGFLAADVIVAQAALITPVTDPQEWFQALLQATLAMRAEQQVPEDEITIATLALYNRHRHQIWMRGDCQLAYRQEGGDWQTFDKAQSELEKEYCRLRSNRIWELLKLPENQDWPTNASTRAYLATEGWKVALQARKDMEKPHAGMGGVTHYTPSENLAGGTPLLDVIDLPINVTHLAIGTDGLISLRPTLAETMILRENLQQDPFMIGMTGNAFLMPKGLVNKDTGEIGKQFDDEAAIWLTFAS